MLTLRIRSVTWFTAGITIAMALVWSFTAWRASAIGSNESTFVPVTPVRILDSRDPTNVGLPGPLVSAVPQDLHVAGHIDTTTGHQEVVPVGATGVVLNVTAVSPTADGFVSIRPADTPGAPTTSSLNVVSGEILPNAVTVSLPTVGADAGTIEITFDAYGSAGPTTDILIDVVGYNINSGLQDLEARLTALEATPGPSDLEARLTALETAPIVMSHGPGSATINSANATSSLEQTSSGIEFTADGFINISLHGPISTNGGEPYTLREVEYCVRTLGATARIDRLFIVGFSGTTNEIYQDETDRNVAGCYVITPIPAIQAQNAFSLLLAGAGGTHILIGSVTSTWVPRSVLGVTDDGDSDDELSQVSPEIAGGMT